MVFVGISLDKVDFFRFNNLLIAEEIFSLVTFLKEKKIVLVRSVLLYGNYA